MGRVLPSGGALAAALGLVWAERGSIAAAHWLPYAVGLALVLAVVFVSGAAVRPPRLAAVGVAALTALAAWTALSLSWSPSPALARDEALLTLFYAFALAVPLVSLRAASDRLRATELFVAAVAGSALATAVAVRFGDGPYFFDGRLSYPISYTNALAAFFLLAFWPAVAVASRRSAAVAVRALAVGAAALVVAAWLATQSKGAGLGLAVSAVVFFAISPQRLRAALPALAAAAVAVAATDPLTEPYRTSGPDAVRGAGTALLAVAFAGTLLGLVYALVDRRVVLSPGAVRTAGRAAAAAVVVLLAAGVVGFGAAVGSPGRFVEDQWETFKTNEEVDAGTHLSDLGSNRYDFWRVALGQFEEHPLAGVGGRGFGALYLQHRSSQQETPRRAHSLALDSLMEVGVVGFALLVLGIAAPLLAAARHLRRPSAAAAVAGATLWLTDAAVDWIWTLPAAGIPFFVLLGIGASDDAAPFARTRVPAAVAVVAAVLLFAPPWLAARLVERATQPADLRGARILDPVSAQPLLTEARLTPVPASLEPYAEAAEREPREWQVRYEYGVALLAAGRRDEAREQLEAAQRLWPGQQAIAQALRRTR